MLEGSYLDTSFLLKVYLIEQESAAAQRWLLAEAAPDIAVRS